MQSFFKPTDNLKNPFFIGTVEDNNDPTFNYRVKVRIENIHNSNITTEQLPWAGKVDCSLMGIGDNSDILHAVPEIGSKVLLLAIGNDINSLVYIGNLYKNTQNTPKNENYLNTYGIYRKDGQFIGIDKLKSLFKMIFNGNLEISADKNITVKAQNVTVEAALTKINKGQVEITNATTSCFNCIPQCLFTGATHVSNKTM